MSTWRRDYLKLTTFLTKRVCNLPFASVVPLDSQLMIDNERGNEGYGSTDRQPDRLPTAFNIVLKRPSNQSRNPSLHDIIAITVY